MDTEVRFRRFAWGLSQGIIVLGCAGGFWLLFGLFKGTAAVWSGPLMTIAACTVVGVGVGAIMLGAVRLRRLSGFSRQALRVSSERDEARGQMRQFAVVNLLQWVACGAVAAVTVILGRLDLMWPLFGIIVGVHFLPLARIFHVPVYTVLGFGLLAVSIAALLSPEPLREVVLGGGSGLLMWLAAAYLLKTTTATMRTATRVPPLTVRREH
jgi:hypothetical protein